MPKIDFQNFEGKDPRGWYNKCENYFQLNPLLDARTKVLYVAFYFEGNSDVWYRSIQEQYPDMKWEELVRQVCNSLLKEAMKTSKGSLTN